MTNEEKYEYWLEVAEYDLGTAEHMLSSSRYVYVAFMCQQALEKLTKGLFIYWVDDDVPRVHNISFILKKVLDVVNLKADDSLYELLDKLVAFYLHGRYPTYTEKLSESINQEEATELFEKSKGAFIWIKSLKK
jgi:HEPN domain-containing protein